MKSLFATLGLGILYLILSPVILAIFALMLVFSILVVVINTLFFPFKFFTGKKLGIDEEQMRLKEAKSTRKLGQAMQAQQSNYQQPYQNYPQQNYPNQQPYQNQQNYNQYFDNNNNNGGR